MLSLGPLHRSVVDFILEPKLATPFKIDQYRAEIAVNTLFCVFAWSLVSAGLVGWWVGSWPLAGLVAAAAALCLVIALVMRLTDQLAGVGAGFGGLLGVIWAGVAWFTGGLGSFAASWLVMLVVVGLVFGGKKLAGWLAAVFAGLSVAVYIGAPPLESAAAWIDTAQAAKLEFVGIGSLGFGLLTVGLLREGFIDWLILSARQIAAEANTFVQTAPVGLITFDMEGNVFRANRASGELFGYDGYQGVMEHTVHDLLEDIDPNSFERQADVVSEGRRTKEDMDNSSYEAPTTLQVTGRRGDGETFLAEIAGARLPDDRGVMLAVRDITEREAYQDKLRTARDEALEASRAKSTFLANMSHELRTPLNAVIGYSEMLIEEAQFSSEEEGATPALLADFTPDLDRICTAGRHQLALINDILDISKIEAGKMDFHYETFEVGELLEDIVSTVKPLAAKNDNELVLEVDPAIGSIHSDITKCRQVLFNLLSNACKFTEDGTVELKVSLDGDEAVFTVSDDGIGMSDEQLGRVFEAFTQADGSTTRRFGGTGLGLTIAQHFCHGLGGDISVDSTEGEGTDFHVRLPVEHGA